jgi:predicted MFS family arabinose efflux permease
MVRTGIRAAQKENLPMAEQQKAWDTAYEWKAVTLLGLGFGLVGLDRWIIAPMLPKILPDLGLNAQDAGNIIGALGLSWGVFAIIMGGISDKIGLRKVLIPSILGFSLLSGLSGMATGLTSLILIRVVMGFTEGSFAPTSFAATNDASNPKRLGINQGIQQCGFALFGLAIAPILATQLLQVMSWRSVFLLVAVPGFILGILMFFVIREPRNAAAAAAAMNPHAGGTAGWSQVLKVRNILLSMAALFCAMTGVFVLSGMLSLYLTGYLKLTLQQSGFVASAVGWGGFLGQFAWPGLSDILGRRVTAVVGFMGAAVMLYFFQHTGANMGMLFGLLFVAAFFTLGLVALLTGPIATEAAPVGLISSAIGLVVGSGEISAGVAQLIAGFVAKNFGIQNILYLPLGAVVLGVFITLFLKETAPRKVHGRPQPVRLAA